MHCQVVRSYKRDIDLFRRFVTAGSNTLCGWDTKTGKRPKTHLAKPTSKELSEKLSKMDWARCWCSPRHVGSVGISDQYCEKCQRYADGLAISEQLELFTEPTESSQQLMSHAERRVTFHTADLTPDERTVIEGGFIKASFDVCFATSTLAAGVNFPFRTVIIAKLTYGYGDREGRLFSRSDFRNMSGRAGRLGHHEDGRVILLPSNSAEATTREKACVAHERPCGFATPDAERPSDCTLSRGREGCVVQS